MSAEDENPDDEWFEFEFNDSGLLLWRPEKPSALCPVCSAKAEAAALPRAA